MYKSPTIGMHYGDPAPDAVPATPQEIAEYEAVLTRANTEHALTAAIQAYLDATARAHRYDNIHTACGWAGEFADASALKTWAAACWRKSGEIEAAVAAGTRLVPTEAELIAELPPLVLP